MTIEQVLRAWLNDPRSGREVFGRNFDQLCAALCFQACRKFGFVAHSYSSANLAYQAAKIESFDMDAAPAWSFGYWDIGRYGDVAISLGDGRWFRTSAHLSDDEMWAPGSHVGALTSAEYVRRTGAKPLGWSYRFGDAGQIITLTPAALDVTPIVPAPETEEPDMPNASIVRNYSAEIGRGQVATALIYPDGSAVHLHATDDVDSAVIAHVQVYGLQPTTNDPAKTTPRDRFGSQLNDAQWDAFWKFYPGKKIGF